MDLHRNSLGLFEQQCRETITAMQETDLHSDAYGRLASINFYSEDYEEQILALEDEIIEKLRMSNGGIRQSHAMIYFGRRGKPSLKSIFSTTNSLSEAFRVNGRGDHIYFKDVPQSNTAFDDTGATINGWTYDEYVEDVIPFFGLEWKHRKGMNYSSKPTAVVVIGPKGGSHKTTNTEHLAIAASLTGARVALLDFDPQATLSIKMGYLFSGDNIPSNMDTYSMVRDMHQSDSVSACDYMRPTRYPNIDIVSGSSKGAFIDAIVNENPEILSKAIQQLKDSGDYDLVMVDTRPATLQQEVNLAYAADSVVFMSPASATGLMATAQGIRNVRDYIDNSGLEMKNRIYTKLVTDVHSSNQYHISNSVLRIQNEMELKSQNPSGNLSEFFKQSNIIADCSNRSESVFTQIQQQRTPKSLNASIQNVVSVFNELFKECIAPHWVDIESIPVSIASILDNGSSVDAILNGDDPNYFLTDVGVAFALEKINEPELKVTNEKIKTNNPDRFVMGRDIGHDGYQIIYKDGGFHAVTFDLLTEVNPTLYPLRSK